MNKTLHLLIASLALAVTSHALPVVLYHHTGDINPTTEAWTALGSGSTVMPVNDSGTPAWSIVNNSPADTGAYEVIPTIPQVTDASLGWSYCVTLHVTDPGLTPAGSMLAIYRDGARSYQMHFGSDANGNPLVLLSDGTGGGTGGAQYTVTGSKGFNIYELIYSPTAYSVPNSATLYVNGAVALSGYTGFGSTQRKLDWGDGSTQVAASNLSKGNYAKVVFSILPKQCGLLRGNIIETVALSSELVPTAPVGAKFLTFGKTAINSLKHFAFKAQLALDAAVPVTVANDMGIFADQGSIPLNLIAREGGIAAGTTAPYLTFFDPIINNIDKVAFVATLGAGSTSANNCGIWSDSTGTLSLVARKGSIAPGTGGAQFLAFQQIVLPDSGGTVFLAQLKVGTGTPAVTSANNLGVWGTNTAGLVTLLVRTGDTFSVEAMGGACCVDKTIEKLCILPCLPTVGAQGRSWELDGDLGFNATFTDGTSGVFHLLR